ncbi:MAG: DUF192 domain-containing protein [Acidimicrobiales bacterium]
MVAVGSGAGATAAAVVSALAVDGRRVCALETPRTPRDRRRGLIGREGITGAFFLPRCPAVHTVGMRFAIDVAFVDRRMVVVEVVTMAPGRLGWPRWRARSCVEAEAGSFARWGLRRGSRLELRTSEEA